MRNYPLPEILKELRNLDIDPRYVHAWYQTREAVDPHRMAETLKQHTNAKMVGGSGYVKGKPTVLLCEPTVLHEESHGFRLEKLWISVLEDSGRTRGIWVYPNESAYATDWPALTNDLKAFAAENIVAVAVHETPQGKRRKDL